MILPAQRRQARLAIHRLGASCTIKEPTGETVNGYGKKDGSESWSGVADEKVVRTYTRSSAPAQARLSGGRYRTESPVLVFRDDSAIEEGFRVEYPDGRVYEVDALTPYPSHLEGTTTVVN
ncbi:head-tail adaptor protein [Haloterrigena salifodinae]|uniref:Head-tail adaptor protein n=1 Tax=Haloterrigena salifodinae TaxID=2675099 RepID=A0A8T8DZW3_9EURY|nr:head-tail adaptor protein [Haloterrigena salifodinae]QRV15029.1 head-tail adaptor protein [Haloterrigena salifodinae]